MSWFWILVIVAVIVFIALMCTKGGRTFIGNVLEGFGDIID